MIIGQIKNGIVLDHITAGRSMEIYNVLGLDKLGCTVAMIQNADSEKMGKKDIIKVGQVIDLDFAVLGYIDPGITVNIIEDGKLVKREHLTLRRVWWTSSTATIRAASPPPNRSCTMSSGWWTARGSATAASTARAKRRCISNKTAGKSPQHIQSKRVRRGPMAAPY